MSFQTPGRLSAGDFKKMLQTPRRPVSASELFAAKKPAAAEQPKREKKTKEPRGDGGGGGSDSAAARRAQHYKKKEQEGERYRDRARERLLNSNPDYKNDEKIVTEAGLTPRVTRLNTDFQTPAYQTPFMQLKQQPDFRGVKMKQGAIANPEAEQEVTPEEEAAERQRAIHEEIEKSKFLGGDEEHTHLVRGLDFELFRKTKAALEAKKVAAAAPLREDPQASEKASKLLAKIAEDKRREPEVECKTSLGAAVFSAIRPRGRRGAAQGLFVVDMSPGAPLTSIPQNRTQAMSSFAAAPKVATARVDIPTGLLDALKTITVRRDEGAYGGMKQRKAREKDQRMREELMRKEAAKLRQQAEREQVIVVRDTREVPPSPVPEAAKTAPSGVKAPAAADDDDDFELFPGVGGMEEIGTPERAEGGGGDATAPGAWVDAPQHAPRAGAAGDDDGFDVLRELRDGDGPRGMPLPPERVGAARPGAAPVSTATAAMAQEEPVKQRTLDIDDEFADYMPLSAARPGKQGLYESYEDEMSDQEEEDERDVRKEQQRKKMREEAEFKAFMKQHEQRERKRKQPDAGHEGDAFMMKRPKH